jgi:hypothetical protein
VRLSCLGQPLKSVKLRLQFLRSHHRGSEGRIVHLVPLAGVDDGLQCVDRGEADEVGVRDGVAEQADVTEPRDEQDDCRGGYDDQAAARGSSRPRAVV